MTERRASRVVIRSVAMGVARGEMDRAVRELMHFSALLNLSEAMRRCDYREADTIAEDLIRASTVIYKDDPLAQSLLVEGAYALRQMNTSRSLEAACRHLAQQAAC